MGLFYFNIGTVVFKYRDCCIFPFTVMSCHTILQSRTTTRTLTVMGYHTYYTISYIVILSESIHWVDPPRAAEAKQSKHVKTINVIFHLFCAYGAFKIEHALDAPHSH